MSCGICPTTPKSRGRAPGGMQPRRLFEGAQLSSIPEERRSPASRGSSARGGCPQVPCSPGEWDRSMGSDDISQLVSPGRSPNRRSTPRQRADDSWDRSMGSEDISQLVSPDRAGRCPNSGRRSTTSSSSKRSHSSAAPCEETVQDIEKLEFVEKQNIEEDLRRFQKARRKLVYNVAALQLVKEKCKKRVSQCSVR